MMTSIVPLSTTLEVRDRCLCLHTQRAARAMARRFDEAFRPFGITSGQFSLLMSLNRPEPPRIADLAPFLAMDRTTLTAALKPLQRRGLVAVEADASDARAKRLLLTRDGEALLAEVAPVWRATHDAIDAEFASGELQRLRDALLALGKSAEPQE